MVSKLNGFLHELGPFLLTGGKLFWCFMLIIVYALFLVFGDLLSRKRQWVCSSILHTLIDLF